MKKMLFTLITCLMVTLSMAQVPNFINYQAVARNAAGQALANQTIKVRLTISDVTEPTYIETRSVTTNALGLFNIQIGSPGAISSTGLIGEVNWLTPGGLSLKVELDINNSGLFTDMGTQKLVSVPFAFASNESANLNGYPIDRQSTPNAGDRLKFDGSKWVSVKKDTVFNVGGNIGNIPVISNDPWQFAGPTTTITVTGNETILANLSGAFGHPQANNVLVSVAVCYQNISGGAITNFNPQYTDAVVFAGAFKTLLTTSAAIKLPAGTYRIGFGIKNKSLTTILSVNDAMSGTIQVTY